MKRYSVYGVGNALVDTEIQVEDSDLASFGVDKGVMTLVDSQRQYELSQHLSQHLVTAARASGGSAANTIIATTQFGGSGFYSCKVAADDDGDFYLADLEAAGVEHNWVGGREEGTTGRCLVLISPDAERSMNSYLGISETMTPEQLVPGAIEDSEYVYLEGYLVTSDTGRAAAIEARQIAQSAGVKTALSFSDPGMVEFFRDGMGDMLGDAGVDLLFCNEEEALGWAQSDDLEQAADNIRKVAKNFVITLGARGAIVFEGEQRHEIAAHAVEAIDTNGAGDMFAGAFLYAITHGHSFKTAGDFASLCSSAVVSRFGPRLSSSEHDALHEEFFGEG